jgi:hypothetical protein
MAVCEKFTAFQLIAGHGRYPDSDDTAAGLHNDVIRLYDDAGNVIETHEHKGDFKEW